ncbi:Ferritin-like superfamily [Phaffia rhodozyma]|uniref:Ferritin-like superfamily n=1 Tax=Phaffia rhodozyma TaxID=264483 RepID=A0A0F7SN07_PHARH|nr:stress response protein Rds1p [Phaffia rhodozyma]CDZ98487.1 Ferritin-like superfamily [Phaffia rhodozyma]
MVSTSIIASLLAASASVAAAAASSGPIRQRDNIDTTILQYALTLEHLENAFYSEALSKFDSASFEAAGLPDWVRRRVVQIGQHEASHVAFLQTALGDAATKPCTYNFGLDAAGPKGFLGLASVIENVGVAAYLGAANKITNPAYVTAAGSILTVEARHQAWLNSAVLKEAPFSGPYDTPLGFSDVYSIAAAFITSCPETNPTLPVKAFPAATVVQTTYKAGDKVTLKFPTTGAVENLIIYSGLTATVVAIPENFEVVLPATLQGTSYAVITTASAATDVSDENTVAGPLIFDFPINSRDVSA